MSRILCDLCKAAVFPSPIPRAAAENLDVQVHLGVGLNAEGPRFLQTKSEFYTCCA